jgi:hypothetical protein
MLHKKLGQTAFYFIHRMCFAGFVDDGCYFHFIKPAGYDVVEDAQVVADVDCHPVVRYELGDADADGSNFTRLTIDD